MNENILLNMNFSQVAYLLTGDQQWEQSPACSWIRSPHMSKHFPHVKEETLILVKVGHLRKIYFRMW